MRALDLHDVTLVGESFGGWVVTACAVAAARAGSTLPPIAKLVIVDGGLLSLLPSGATGTCTFDPVGCIYDPAARAEARAFLSDHPLLDNEATKAKTSRESGLRGGEPTAAAIGTIRVPTLVIWGDKDELVPLAVGRKAAALIPGARLSLIADAGHVPMIEKPTQFARLVLDFVAR